MQIKKVGVLGCGLMGSGIAQVAAMASFDVVVLEVEQKFLDKGFAGIEKSLAKFAERPVEKGDAATSVSTPLTTLNTETAANPELKFPSATYSRLPSWLVAIPDGTATEAFIEKGEPATRERLPFAATLKSVIVPLT